MRILQVIHRYPPYYRAGSETYTWLLSRELSKKGHDVTVFTRIENVFHSAYTLQEKIEDNIRVIRVNRPIKEYVFKSKYIDKKIEEIFEELLLRINPQIVHVGHLSHLSTNIVSITKKYGYPLVFTLHDYWLLCMRGQLITRNNLPCTGPTVKGCSRCFSNYFSREEDANKEIEKYLKHMKKIREWVDHYIAPTRFLMNIYLENGIPPEKISLLDYGFNKNMFNDFKKKTSKKLRFGFLGRLVPTKGIHLLLNAFRKIPYQDVELHVHGTLEGTGNYLQIEYADDSRVKFHGEYDYTELPSILSDIDVLVVPSIWYENSPLVIHEAFMAGIPVITSNFGGMAELVTDHLNGLLFKRGDVEDLKRKMEAFIEDRSLLLRLKPEDHFVLDLGEHVHKMEKIYENVLNGIS